MFGTLTWLMFFSLLTSYLFFPAFFLPPFFEPPFLAAFFLVAIVSFLLLSFQGYDHKILCCCNSCGLEKTAHNMLLYKLNSFGCQQFITSRVNYFYMR